MTRISPTVLLGKTIRQVARLRGGGSALPGLVVERIQPTFLADSLNQLPKGVIIVTGTNGKTTTTKMISELLTTNGLRVLTNRSGSNFTRGIVATIIEQMDLDGTLQFDIAVLELDEAYAKRFITKVKPHYVVALNIMRDQLDRFGEIDATARLLRPVIESATVARIINRDDPHLAPIGRELDSKEIKTHFFGVHTSLRALFPTDDELQARDKKTVQSPTLAGDVELAKVDGQKVSYTFGKQTFATEVQISGSYNFQNAGAALALVKAILPDVEPKSLVEQLATIKPAFGRGEKIIVDGQEVELVLVKNPAGFRLSLSSFLRPGQQYMIAINDNYADGRDMSWLWDVEFDELADCGVSVVSGIRAYDMALRLQYDEVLIGQIEPKISLAVKQFVLNSEHLPKVIFCSYTAMLAIRRELKKYSNMERGL